MSGKLDLNALGTVFSEADKVWIGGAPRTLSSVSFDVSATTTTVVNAVSGQKIYVVGVGFTVDTDSTTFKMTEVTLSDLFAAMTYMKGSGMVNNPPSRVLWPTTTANKALSITTVGGKATGTLWYAQF